MISDECMMLHGTFGELSRYECSYANTYAGLSDTDKKKADEKRVEQRAAVLAIIKVDKYFVERDELKHAFNDLAKVEVELDKLESGPGYDSEDDIDTLNYLSTSIDLARDKVLEVARKLVARADETTDEEAEPAPKRARKDD